MAELRIGMIGLDTSHVTAFTKLLNDPGDPHHVGGAKVTVAFPGGSQDFPLSRDRVKGFTDELRDKHGVKIVDSPAAVAEQSDLVFIESVDGRAHRALFEQVARFKKPTFIDKPFVTTLEDGQAIYRLAEQNGIPIMSCSSLRYSPTLTEALAGKRETVMGCDVYGPMDEEAALPGLFWYGCHTVEMIVAIMGVGCTEVQAFRNADGDIIRLTWRDGRLVSLRGVRNLHWNFGVTLHRKEEVKFVDAYASAKPLYAYLLEAILRSLPHGRSDVPKEETLEITRIILAANQSRKDGAVVRIA